MAEKNTEMEKKKEAADEKIRELKEKLTEVSTLSVFNPR